MDNAIIKPLYDQYSFHVIPKIGEVRVRVYRVRVRVRVMVRVMVRVRVRVT